jgi:hypothetical protein
VCVFAISIVYVLCMSMHLLSLYMHVTSGMNILDRRKRDLHLKYLLIQWIGSSEIHRSLMILGGRTCVKESENPIRWVGWLRTLTEHWNAELIGNSSMVWCRMQQRPWNHYKIGYCPCLQMKTIDIVVWESTESLKFQSRKTMLSNVE